jgi:hypothetical protein
MNAHGNGGKQPLEAREWTVETTNGDDAAA